ncbi:MAG: UDP-3-O-(3-hydroxymyristoyl)glucosamine N-acyltransferase [Gammaproteobacteria bacterium]|nr:UDP-3-O-(3-hydroxymyristoyl)glucosamine N-acyltransferase [Gammaproteobacteria bacterium]
MHKLGDIAQYIGAELIGDANCAIERVATLANARSGDITFITNARYKNLLPVTKASAVIIPDQYRSLLKTNGIVVKDPYVAYARIAALLYASVSSRQGIHPSSSVGPGCRIAATAWIGPNCVVDSGVMIGENTYIGPGTVIEKDAVIGNDCFIVANATICHGVIIGDRAILHPGVVIGSDGFGLANDDGKWVKIPQIGTVRVGHDVEIGANTTIDRGAIEDTVIGDGAKVDNLVQIAHNVQIGAHTAIAGCTGIAGSAKIGSHCQLGGGVGVVGHLEIADHVQITGMSKVSSSITEPGVYSSGTPLQPYQKWQRNMVRVKQLDEMSRRLKALEEKLNQQKKED